MSAGHIHCASVLISVVLAGCQIDLTVPEQAEISCENDDQCPGEQICHEVLSLCVNP